MKSIYNLSDVGRKAWWLHPLFKPLLTLLLLVTLGVNVFAQHSMLGSSFCYNGTTNKTTLGLDGGTPGMYHVLLQFKPDGSIIEKTLVLPSTTDPFNFVVDYGTAPGSEGLYVTYIYTQLQYLALLTNSYALPFVQAGIRQGLEVWIYASPSVQNLGFYGTEGVDYTSSGGVAIYCADAAGVTLNDSELSLYTYLVTAGVITTDLWVVNYQLYDGLNPVGTPKPGTGIAIDWTGLTTPPNTFTATATRGLCAAIPQTGAPQINDEATVKNTNTGLCYLTIEEAIDDPLTDDGHTLWCLVAQSYVEDLDISKGITLMPDPALVGFCDINGFIHITADDVTIKNFDVIASFTSDYAIKVFAPSGNYTIDYIPLLASNLDGILIEGGAGGGTISNNNLYNAGTGIDIAGSLTGILTISNNIIEGDEFASSDGIGNLSDDVVIDGNIFNNVQSGVINAGNDVTIVNNVFWNILAGGTSIVNTGTGVKAHDNDFSFGPTPTDVTAINSTEAMDATNNWYGHPTGPTIASNPCGLGSLIIGAGVDYSPWWYNEEMTTLNGLPAITLSEIPDMSTITHTPLIISVTATYPGDLANYDPAVLTDALITSSVTFPAGAQVISVKYKGDEVLASPYMFAAGVNSVYLSEILGAPAGNPLNGHSGTISWDITVASFDAPWSSTLKLDAVTYIGATTACKNILGSEFFGVAFDDALMAITPTDIEVCTTIANLKFDVSITFPAITEVNDAILADARITSDVAIPAGTELTWTYDGVVTGTYLFGADVTTFLLSDIVGMSAPLQGHTATDVWSFDIVMAVGTYNLTIEALAVLDTEEYVYETDNVTLTVHPLPTATLSVLDNQTHICTGTEAHFSVALTGTAPWSITYTDGTTPVTVNDILVSPYTFDVVHTENLTWTITNVSDAYCSNTGTGSVRIYIGTVTYVGIPDPLHPCEGSYVEVPIQVQKFEDVGVVSLTLNYNPAVLEYVDFTNPNPSFPFTLDGDIPGVIKAGGFGSVAFQLADDDTLFNIRFKYLGGPPLYTAMKWDTINPASCEYVSFQTNLPFCDEPGLFYYHNLVTDLAGYLRPKANVSIAPANTPICAGKSTTFNVSLIGEQPWSFTYSDGTNEFTVSPITTPSYDITVTPAATTTYTPVAVSDVRGCATILGDLTGSATVVVNQLPVLDLTATMVTCNGANDGKIDLDVTGTTPFDFYWEATTGTFTSTDQNISNLYPSTYMVTVTDDNGCEQFGLEIITEPFELDALVESTDVTCNGAGDGTITVSDPTGGYGEYEVSIDGFIWHVVTPLLAPLYPGGSYTFEGLAPGFYTVFIRDAENTGCVITLDASLQITEPDALDATVTATNITCNGADDGIIDITLPEGGYGNYEYTIDGWLTSHVSGLFEGLVPGFYDVQMRDADHRACVKILDATLEITEEDELDADVAMTDITCFGLTDGTITISNPSGGYGTYEYSINGGLSWENDGIYTGLLADTYDVRIRDAAHTGCFLILDGTLVIAAPEILDADLASTDETCFGVHDGTITISNPSGGWGTFEFTINGGSSWENDGIYTGLDADTYDVRIRDAAHTACEITLNGALIIGDQDILDADVNHTDITCNGADDGTITVSLPTGGHGTYQVSIDNLNWAPLTTAVPVVYEDLAPDTYTVLIQDAAYTTCEINLGDVLITEPDELEGTVTSTDVTCFDAADGTITISGISGGYGSYAVSVGVGWVAVPLGNTTYTFENLDGPQTYVVKLRDADQILCETTLEGALFIDEPDILDADVAHTDITCFEAGDGTITITNPTGGHGFYEYAISHCLGYNGGPDWQSSGSFTGIAPGSYDVLIRDRDYPDCVITLSSCLEIIEPVAITLSGTVKYYNPTLFTPLYNVTVTLQETGSSYSQSVTTDIDGDYLFDNVCPGTYQIITTSNRVFGPLENPVNITDAALVSQWSVAPVANTERVKYYAGDVVQNNRLASADASRIKQYFLTSGTVGWLGRPEWTFWLAGETFSTLQPAGPIVYPDTTISPGDDNLIIDLYGLFTGDFNTSWVPSVPPPPAPLNALVSKLRLDAAPAVMVEPGVEFELPVNVSSSMEVGAISMLLNFPADKLEITGAYLSSDVNTPVMVNLMGDELRIGWMSTNPVNLNTGDRLITLKLRLTAALPKDEQVQLTLTGSPLNELADGTVTVISNAVLYAGVIKSTATAIGEITSAKLGFANYPNPFNETTTFVCNLPSAGLATIEVYDMLGKKVNVFMNESMTAGEHKLTINSNTLQPGVYTAILSLNADGQLLKRTIKLIRNQ